MEKNITQEDKSGSMFRVSGLDFFSLAAQLQIK